MFFQLVSKDTQSKARAGIIETAHGTIETPIFMPVGTAGAVKAVQPAELKEKIHAQIILGNTYHLFLRPGTDVLKAAGGLHRFNGWDKTILTDSGGYQVFSLADNRKISEEGTRFQSHIDGTKFLFTPENVMDIQRAIGADIIMAFDECTPYPCEYKPARKSMELTHRWLKRCIEQFQNTEPLYGYEQYLFPIVQGSVYEDLRKESAQMIADSNMPGCAIGGLSVGEPEAQMYEMAELCCDILPANKPRYLMGIGTPVNMLKNIALGVDMFDCVMPTRNGRNGMLFTSQGIINIRNKKWQYDFSVIDEALSNDISNYFSKAYLRHLLIAGEILGLQIASIQNLSFYLWLMKEARRHILQGDYTAWMNEMIPIISRRL